MSPLVLNLSEQTRYVGDGIESNYQFYREQGILPCVTLVPPSHKTGNRLELNNRQKIREKNVEDEEPTG